jgi:ATP-dependent Lon protease
LSGELLPVGGIRDKVLAAARRGYRAVIVPARNRDDVKRLAKSIHEDIEIHLITCADDAIQLALQAPLRGKRGNASGSRARRAAKPRKK